MIIVRSVLVAFWGKKQSNEEIEFGTIYEFVLSDYKSVVMVTFVWDRIVLLSTPLCQKFVSTTLMKLRNSHADG